MLYDMYISRFMLIVFPIIVCISFISVRDKQNLLKIFIMDLDTSTLNESGSMIEGEKWFNLWLISSLISLGVFMVYKFKVSNVG